MITHDVAERSGGDKKKQNRQRANKNVQTECWIGKIIVCDNDDILNEWADKKQDNSDKIKIRVQTLSVSRIQTTRLETYPWRISIAREPNIKTGWSRYRLVVGTAINRYRVVNMSW